MQANFSLNILSVNYSEISCCHRDENERHSNDILIYSPLQCQMTFKHAHSITCMADWKFVFFRHLEITLSIAMIIVHDLGEGEGELARCASKRFVTR